MLYGHTELDVNYPIFVLRCRVAACIVVRRRIVQTVYYGEDFKPPLNLLQAGSLTQHHGFTLRVLSECQTGF
jgi:hypothetical protein